MSADLDLNVLKERVEYLNDKFQREKDEIIRESIRTELIEAEEKLKKLHILFG